MSSLVALSSKPTNKYNLQWPSCSKPPKPKDWRNSSDDGMVVALPEATASPSSSLSASIQGNGRGSTKAAPWKLESRDESKSASSEGKKLRELSLFDGFDLSRLEDQMELLADKLQREGDAVVVVGELEPQMMHDKRVQEGDIGFMEHRACRDEERCHDGDHGDSSFNLVPQKVNAKNGRVYHGSLDQCHVFWNETYSGQCSEGSGIWISSVGVKKGVRKSFSAVQKLLQRVSRAVKGSANHKREQLDQHHYHHYHHHHYHHHSYGEECCPADVHRIVRRIHFSDSEIATAYPSTKKARDSKGQEGVRHLTTLGLSSLSPQGATMVQARRNAVSMPLSFLDAKEEFAVRRTMADCKPDSTPPAWLELFDNYVDVDDRTVRSDANQDLDNENEEMKQLERKADALALSACRLRRLSESFSKCQAALFLLDMGNDTVNLL